MINEQIREGFGVFIAWYSKKETGIDAPAATAQQQSRGWVLSPQTRVAFVHPARSAVRKASHAASCDRLTYSSA